MEIEEIEELIKNFDEKDQKEICVKFSIACAEKCLPIFELHFPNNNKPKQAIEFAKEWLKKSTETVTATNIVNAAVKSGRLINNNKPARSAAYSSANAARTASHNNITDIICAALHSSVDALNAVTLNFINVSVDNKMDVYSESRTNASRAACSAINSAITDAVNKSIDIKDAEILWQRNILKQITDTY